MNLLWGAAAVAVALVGEIALGAWAPSAHRYVDFMMLPVIGYALGKSQRAAMTVGCLGGLLEDAWFQSGLFGASGFSKTLLGWSLGGVGTRFELDAAGGRAAAGALLPVLDRFVDFGLRKLFAVPSAPPAGVDLALRGAAGALLTLVIFAILDRGSLRLNASRRRGRRLR